MMNSSPGVFSCWQVGGTHRYMDFLPLPILLVAPEMFLFFSSHLCRIANRKKVFIFAGDFSAGGSEGGIHEDNRFGGGGGDTSADRWISIRRQQTSTCCSPLWGRLVCVGLERERRAAGGVGTLMVSRVKEMAVALFYYLCFSPLPPPPSLPNGICLALNNSSIKSQVRNKELNSQAPLRPLWLSLKDGTLAARD